MGYSISTPRWLQNAQWFIKLRWYAIIVALTSILGGNIFLNANLPFHNLYLLVFLLLLINVVYMLLIRSRVKAEKKLNIQHVRLFLNLQVSVDLFFLTAFLHFSGGIENPALVFYIFHMILSSILLPRIDSLLQATFSQLMFVMLIVLEYKMILPHYTLNENLLGLFKSDVTYLTIAIGIFSVTSYMVVILTSYVTRQLRDHELDLEHLNNELKEKDRIKNEYVLRLTHDIKGYVSSIKSSLEVINRRVYGEIDIKYVPFLDGANKVIKDLSRFIRDLLQLTRSKLEGGNDLEIVDINNLMDLVIEEMNVKTSEKKIKIELKIEHGQKKLEVLLISVKEMLTNLISNAIKYSNKNTTVTVDVKPFDQNFALFRISDQGVGIPKNEIKKLFKEFYRASNVKKKFEGTGLGLSIVKQIASNHEGQVWVESEEGKGTSFYVTLPYRKTK